MLNVLFVCTGNACRSQVAEAMNVFRDCSGEIHEQSPI